MFLWYVESLGNETYDGEMLERDDGPKSTEITVFAARNIDDGPNVNADFHLIHSENARTLTDSEGDDQSDAAAAD